MIPNLFRIKKGRGHNTKIGETLIAANTARINSKMGTARTQNGNSVMEDRINMARQATRGIINTIIAMKNRILHMGDRIRMATAAMSTGGRLQPSKATTIGSHQARLGLDSALVSAQNTMRMGMIATGMTRTDIIATDATKRGAIEAAMIGRDTIKKVTTNADTTDGATTNGANMRHLREENHLLREELSGDLYAKKLSLELGRRIKHMNEIGSRQRSVPRSIGTGRWRKS